MSADEAEIVAALHRGEGRALELAYDRYGRGVYSLAHHLLGDPGAGEEVVQETFLRLWRQPQAFQPGRGSLSTWLLSVAHHLCVDLLRRRRLEQRHREPGHDGDEVTPLAEAIPAALEDEPQARLTEVERRRTVASALASLPYQQRIPLELAYYRGHTQAEIADMLGEPLGTIKTRMRLGLLRLRKTPHLADVRSAP